MVSARASEFLSLLPLKPAGILNDLTTIHKHLFQDTYEWAGFIRTIEIKKAGEDSTDSIPIASAMAGIDRLQFERGLLHLVGGIVGSSCVGHGVEDGRRGWRARKERRGKRRRATRASLALDALPVKRLFALRFRGDIAGKLHLNIGGKQLARP